MKTLTGISVKHSVYSEKEDGDRELLFWPVLTLSDK